MRINKEDTVYPERKALWDTITCFKELPSLISVTKAKFIQLYMYLQGTNKYAHFLRSWNEYIATHTSDNPSPENVIIWQKMIVSYSHTISEDDKRIILCDILHTLQSQLTMYIAKDMEKIDEGDESEVRNHDDAALYHIGSQKILGELYQAHNKGNHKKMKEDIELLKELQLPHDSKTAMGRTGRIRSGRLNFSKAGVIVIPQRN